MIPATLLPHVVIWVRPGTRSDGYGQPTVDWTDTTTTEVRGYMQPVSQREITDGRAAQIGDWLLLTNELEITGADRITWGGDTFEVIGPPARWDSPRGPHHAELLLRRVVG